MIQVGDTVKRTEGDFCGMQVGDTDVVVAVSNHDIRLKTYEGGHSPDKLEVIGAAWEGKFADEMTPEEFGAFATYYLQNKPLFQERYDGRLEEVTYTRTCGGIPTSMKFYREDRTKIAAQIERDKIVAEMEELKQRLAKLDV